MSLAFRIPIAMAMGLAIPAQTAWAQTDAVVTARLTDAYRACRKEAYGGTYPEAVCMDEEDARQDAVLNALWRRTVQGMPRTKVVSLRMSQRAWMRGRDPHCRAEVASQDVINSTATYVFNACRLGMTVHRIMLLERLR